MKFEQMTFDDILTFKRGHDLPHSQRVMGSVPVVSSSGITGYHDQYIDDGEGVITGRYGTLGEIHYVNGKYWPLNTTLYVTDFKNNFPKFIYYFLKTIDFEGANSAGAVPGINRNNLKNIVVRVPCTSTQKKIASILSNYDDLIQTNQQRITLLEEAAQRLYDEWFVKLRFPNHEQVPVVDGVPEGWERTPFKKLVDLINGYPFKPSQLGESGYPVVKIPELRSGVGANTPRNDGTVIPKKYFINRGDIIFSWSGTILIDEWFYDVAILNQHLFNVVPYTQKMKSFVRAALKQSIPEMVGHAIGSTMMHLRRGTIDDYEVLMPPEYLLAVFCDTADDLFSQATNLKWQNQKLMQARDDLLPRLMSGRLDVSTLSAVGEE